MTQYPFHGAGLRRRLGGDPWPMPPVRLRRRRRSPHPLPPAGRYQGLAKRRPGPLVLGPQLRRARLAALVPTEGRAPNKDRPHRGLSRPWHRRERSGETRDGGRDSEGATRVRAVQTIQVLNASPLPVNDQRGVSLRCPSCRQLGTFAPLFANSQDALNRTIRVRLWPAAMPQLRVQSSYFRRSQRR